MVHTYTTPGNHTATLTVWNHLRPDLTYTASKTMTAYGLPAAAFTASRLTGTAPLTVRFTDTSTGIPTIWAWDFGDGTTSTEQNPTHTFTQSGKAYTVRLYVENPAGRNPAPAIRTITVM